MSSAREVFALPSRLLHWLMAVLVVAMLFIGIGMVSTVSPCYEALVAIHRPLGIAILVLVVLRFINRLINPPPPLPADLPAVQRFAAIASHVTLYALPLVGWGMLSAARYPVAIGGGVQLPPILPHSLALYAGLRGLHTALAVLLFALVLLHLGAALFHALVRRDGVFESMAGGKEGRASF